MVCVIPNKINLNTEWWWWLFRHNYIIIKFLLLLCHSMLYEDGNSFHCDTSSYELRELVYNAYNMTIVIINLGKLSTCRWLVWTNERNSHSETYINKHTIEYKILRNVIIYLRKKNLNGRNDELFIHINVLFEVAFKVF